MSEPKKIEIKSFRPSIAYIKNELGEGLLGCEIGVYKGENAVFMLEVLKPKILYLIDPWNNFIDGDSGEIIGETHFQETFDKLKYYNNQVILRQTSFEAVDMFEPYSLDFVYIDGDHTYNSVLGDMMRWFPKIKKGGILAGHDYHESMQGVVRAVQTFVDTNKLDFMTQEQDWWIRK